MYVYLYVCLFVCLFVRMYDFFFLRLFVCMFTYYLCVSLFVCLFVCLSAVCLSLCMFVCLFLSFFVCVFVCMFLCYQFVCLFVCLFVYLFCLVRLHGDDTCDHAGTPRNHCDPHPTMLGHRSFSVLLSKQKIIKCVHFASTIPDMASFSRTRFLVSLFYYHRQHVYLLMLIKMGFHLKIH